MAKIKLLPMHVHTLTSSPQVEKNTVISISGADKAVIGDFAATVRRQREPEPYKGKGIRYEGEVIKLKEGKAGGKKK